MFCGAQGNEARRVWKIGLGLISMSWLSFGGKSLRWMVSGRVEMSVVEIADVIENIFFHNQKSSKTKIKSIFISTQT